MRERFRKRKEIGSCMENEKSVKTYFQDGYTVIILTKWDNVWNLWIYKIVLYITVQFRKKDKAA